MEGFSANLYKGVKGYWRRRSYQRVDGSGSRRKNRVELAGPRRRRFWQIRITPKLRFFNLSSTKKFFIRLRDSYVDMMLGVSSSRALSSGFGGGASGSDSYGFGQGPLKEYDEKAIIDMYKSMISKGELVGRGVGNPTLGVACR